MGRLVRPLAIDLFCGLGGWTEGLLAEGYEVIGFDIERHEYAVPAVGHDEPMKNTGGSWFRPPPGRKCAAKNNPDGRLWDATQPMRMARYPAQLVVQDVLTLHGSQFKDAALIVASPPCQEYSYMAMPWKLAKAKAAAIRADTTGRMLEDLNRLFNACFRIQMEASVAAGRHVPMVVENVRGAIPWVGRSRWNFGSFHLWGDVPALMPWTAGAKANGIKGIPHRTAGHWTNPAEHEGIKNGNDWFGSGEDCSLQRRHGSKSSARKAASAMIAKIPLPLSRHIAAVYREP